MNTYTVQTLIIEADLPPTVKLVGMVLAYHLSRKTGKVRLKRETIAEICGVSVATVKRSVNALIEAGIFERKLTGRSTILSARALVKEHGRVDGSPMTPQKGHRRAVGIETEYSTYAEENGKRNDRIVRNSAGSR